MPLSNFPQLSIQPAFNADQEQIVRLIDDCYQEYGDRVILAGDDRDLLDIEGNYRGRQGEFIVVRDSNDQVVGTHAVVPIGHSSEPVSYTHLTLPTNREV